ncbi:MAG: hypothetical protein JSS25_11660 [Proteobacteria bacterium]|nr:hypothetical protein [Pseudomonadota bacterium]
MQPNVLAALFLPRRRLATAERTLLQRGGPLGGSQWVAPRGQCQYRQQDFSAVPKRQRHAAAELHAKRLVPNSESRVRIGWMDGIAHFWIWENPLPAAIKGRQRWVPEAVLRRPAIANGTYLVNCSSGVEGQIWRDGHLRGSQWWPAVPTLESWHRFLRGAGASIEQSPAVPKAHGLPLLAHPWALLQPERSGRFAGSEFVVWVGCLAVLAAAAGWELASLQQWEKARETQASALEDMRAKAGAILAARESADDSTSQLAALAGLQTGVSDYALIADVIAPLPQGSQLMAWTRETGKIQALVKTKLDDPVKLVLLYRNHALLREVTATPSGEFIQLVFDLPKPPPEESAGSGAVAVKDVAR